MVLKTNKSQR